MSRIHLAVIDSKMSQNNLTILKGFLKFQLKASCEKMYQFRLKMRKDGELHSF